ncbi:MAG: hypothetical protein F7C35_00835 [Desulfurococcales archaeon]|nr:hypothetical protein [Desulfurococcales archaeon]
MVRDPSKPLRMPPRIKVLEAAGAIADGRVIIEESNTRIRATVVGSDGTRKYRVVVERSGNREIRVYSTDNGTRFRGYIGYPIIAVMMVSGLLPRNKKIEEAFKDIEWRRLNETYKKYATVMEIVLRRAETRGVTRAEVEKYINRVLRNLEGHRVIYDPALGGIEAFL